MLGCGCTLLTRSVSPPYKGDRIRSRHGTTVRQLLMNKTGFAARLSGMDSLFSRREIGNSAKKLFVH